MTTKAVPKSTRKSKQAKEAESGGNIPSSQKMAGITWDNMPTMPRKRKSETERAKFRKYDANGPLSAHMELVDAQKELQEAIDEWTKLLSSSSSVPPGKDESWGKVSSSLVPMHIMHMSECTRHTYV